jgi:hypothetical protein
MKISMNLYLILIVNISSDLGRPQLFMKPLSMEATYQVCNNLGGKMVLFGNENETYNFFASISDKQTFLTQCKSKVWVPTKKVDHTWYTYPEANEILTFLPWMVGEPNGEEVGEECIMTKERQYPNLGFVQKYYDFSCYIETCFECAFQRDTILQIRGLCNEQTLIDTQYVFITSLLPQVIILIKYNLSLHSQFCLFQLII